MSDSTSVSLPYGNRTLDQLPLVLAGPILRSVSYSKVAVWAVLRKFPEDVQLRIYQDYVPPRGNNSPFWYSAPDGYEIVTLGTHLHVLLVTAGPQDGQTNLAPRTVYHYDLRVQFPNTDPSSSTDPPGMYLTTPGLVSPPGIPHDNGILGYDGGDLPSFVTPSNDIENLRIVHSSCRKAHGEGKDALKGLDKMLDDTHNNATYRPQQLFLTGDQIYGDDVSDVMAAMIRDTMPILMGYDEEIPGLTTSTAPFADTGARTTLITDVANFTGFGAYSKNHSIKLADYIGLYLFAWSDALWPAELPNFQVTATTSDEDLYDKEREQVEIFRTYLPEARRALANIATYMIFDDHDVTDDWFLHRSVSEAALDSVLGRRIMQNGLTAFSLFQHWGNNLNEAQTTADKRADIHRLAEEIYEQEAASGGNPDPQRTALANVLLPVVEQTMGTGEAEYTLTGGMDWHFSLQFPQYQVIVLNTRTARGFFGSDAESPAGLLSIGALETQLPAQNAHPGKLTILVSPAPVIGHPFMENKIQPFLKEIFDFLNDFDKSDERGASFADLEAWSFSPYIFEHFLHRISAYGQVVALSGDVHYAFSAGVKYWDQRTTDENRSVFAQLTSSATKNEDWKTRIWAFTFPRDKGYLGFDQAATLYRNGEGDAVDRVGTGTPRAFNPGENAEIAVPPKWQYHIDFIDDSRANEDRGIADYDSTFTSIRQRIETAIDFTLGDNLIDLIPSLNPLNAMRIRQVLGRFEGRKVVGSTNIGLVTFDWPASGPKVLNHFLWTDLTYAGDEVLPMTLHTISMDIPGEDDPRPINNFQTRY